MVQVNGPRDFDQATDRVRIWMHDTLIAWEHVSWLESDFKILEECIECVTSNASFEGKSLYLLHRIQHWFLSSAIIAGSALSERDRKTRSIDSVLLGFQEHPGSVRYDVFCAAQAELGVLPDYMTPWERLDVADWKDSPLRADRKSIVKSASMLRCKLMKATDAIRATRNRAVAHLDRGATPLSLSVNEIRAAINTVIEVHATVVEALFALTISGTSVTASWEDMLEIAWAPSQEAT